MVKNKELEILKMLIQSEFKLLNKKISKNDKDIERLIRKIEKVEIIKSNESLYSCEDIPVISYLDT